MKKLNRTISLLLMICMLLTVLPAQAMAAELDAEAPEAGETSGDGTQKMNVTPLDPDDVSVRPQGGSDVDYDALVVTPEGNVRVIIEMEADPILSIGLYAGDAEKRAEYIRNQQESVVERIEEEVLDGQELSVRYSYDMVLNGVAAQVPAESIDAIRKVEGVKRVTVQRVYEPLAAQVSDSAAGAGIPVADSDALMMGAEGAWAQGYMGEGLKIAVIDTGIDTDHPSFAEMDTSAWTTGAGSLMDLEDIAKVLDSLNATENFNKEHPNSTLTAEDLYRSNKIPYAFNYIDVNYNRVGHDYDSQGDHGTHVAGIAAANEMDTTEVVGVAPHAQLMAFKVFGEAGGAYTEDIVASVEDAVKLGANVINMSLGTNGGLRSSGDDIIDAIYDSLEANGIICAVAGGNNYTAGLYNMWGLNQSLTTDVDNGILSSPASYPAATSVASLNNTTIYDYYITVGGQSFPYSNGSTSDGSALGVPELSTIGPNNFGVALVGNMGQTAEDFAAAGVEGKIAMVSRGITAFTAKAALAEAAGAAALIIYNNEEGSMAMDMAGYEGEIPVVMVTKKIGGLILDILAQDPDAQMYVSDKTALINTYEGGETSDFSSWGPLSSLHLEPDIAAPGGGIFSTLNGGRYGEMSGTSMASPNLAGAAALVVQKLISQGFTGEELFARANQLLMSTAEPQIYATNGLYYSPREQGSGLAKVDRAVNTTGYLTVEDEDGNVKAESEAELFDDPDGAFRFTFTVHNTGSVDNYYNVHTAVQTEGVNDQGGLYFMSGLPEELDAEVIETSGAFVGLTYDFDGNGVEDSNDAQWLYDHLADAAQAADSFLYDVDGSGIVDANDVQRILDILVEKTTSELGGQLLLVPAGQSVTVSVYVEVTDEGKAWLDEYFPCGGYVEGYVLLDNLNGDADLSLPYLGFCGDWAEPNMFEQAMYWDDDEDPNAPIYSVGANTIFIDVDGSVSVPGLNFYCPDEPFDVNNIAISPNNDGRADYIRDIYLYLMRNAEWVSVRYYNEDRELMNNDKVIESGDTAYSVPKSCYEAGYGMVVPFVASWYFDTYPFVDPDTMETLPDGTKLTLEVSAKLPYGGEDENIFTWSVPVTVDTKAPEVCEDYDITITKDGDKQYLTITVTDTVNIASVFFTNSSGTVLRGDPIIFDKTDFTPGEPCTVTYDVTGMGNSFCLGLSDYAFNESYYKLTTEDNDPEVDPDVLYGYRVADSEHLLQSGGYDDHVYGWVSIDPETGDYEVQSDDYWVDYAINAAEYYGGYVVAILYSGKVVAIRPGYWDERLPISQITVTNAGDLTVAGYRELAFNPAEAEGETSPLYVMLEMTDENLAPGTYLGRLDVETGEVELCSDEPTESTIRVMAFDDDGVLYGVTTGTGKNMLVTIDTEDGSILEKICDVETAVKAHMGDFATSMTWYDGALYLSFMAHDDGKLVKIVPEKSEDGEITAQVSVVSDMEYDPCFEGLLALDDRGHPLDTESAPESIRMEPDELSLLPGNNASVEVIPTPWYANVKDLVWTSSDPRVVTVNPTSGDMRSVSAGSAVVTATMTGIDGEDISASCQVTVVKPVSELHGFLRADTTGQYNGQWISFDSDDPTDFETLTNYSFFPLVSAEYVDGFIYAYNEYTRSLYRFDTTKEIDPDTGCYQYDTIDWGNADYGIVADLAYNYTDGKLYGLRLTRNQSMVDLIEIDLVTGAQEEVVEDIRLNRSAAIALTIDDEGTVYLVTGNGTFGTVDVETEETTVIGMTGLNLNLGSTTMTMDRSTGDIYLQTWYMNGESQLLWVDKNSGSVQDLGYVLYGAAIVGLYWMPGKDYVAPVAEREEPYFVTPSDLYVVAGSSASIRIDFMPINSGTVQTYSWTVEGGETGITVDENGVVRADASAGGKDYILNGVSDEVDEYDANISITVHVIEKPANDLGLFVTQTPDNHGHIWAKFDISNLDAGNVGMGSSNTFISAAEQYNGKVYAYGYGEGGYRDVEFKILDTKQYEVEKTFQVGGTVIPIDMTMDYTTGVMYAICRGVNESYGANALYAVSINDGSLYKVADIVDVDSEELVDLVTLACDVDGQLYGISVDSKMYEIDKVSGEAESMGLLRDPFNNTYHIKPGEDGEQGREVIYIQSMTFDPDTNNLYWAYSGNRETIIGTDLATLFESKLICITPGEYGGWHCTELGTLSLTGAEAVGLHVFPDVEIPEAKLFDAVLDTTKMVLLQGETATVTALPLPLGLEGCTFGWESDDEAVATVKDGVIKAVGAGEALITVTISKDGETVEKTIEVTVASQDDKFIVAAPGGWTTTPIYDTGRAGEGSGDAVMVSVAHDDETGYWYAVDKDNNLWRYNDETFTEGEIVAKNIIGSIPYKSKPAPSGGLRPGTSSKQEQYFDEDAEISFVDFDVYDDTVYIMASGRLAKKMNYGNSIVDLTTFPTYVVTFELDDVEDEELPTYGRVYSVSSLSTCVEVTVVDGDIYVLDIGENTLVRAKTSGTETVVKWSKYQYDQQADVVDEETEAVTKSFGTGMDYSPALDRLYIVGVDYSNYDGIVVFEIDLSNGEWTIISGENSLIPENFYDVVISDSATTTADISLFASAPITEAEAGPAETPDDAETADDTQVPGDTETTGDTEVPGDTETTDPAETPEPTEPAPSEPQPQEPQTEEPQEPQTEEPQDQEPAPAEPQPDEEPAPEDTPAPDEEVPAPEEEPAPDEEPAPEEDTPSDEDTPAPEEDAPAPEEDAPAPGEDAPEVAE